MPAASLGFLVLGVHQMTSAKGWILRLEEETKKNVRKYSLLRYEYR